MPNDAGKLVSGVRLNSSGGNILEALKLADAVRYAKRLARDNELLLVVGADVSHCRMAPHIGPEVTASCQRAGHGDVLWMKTPGGVVLISSNGA